MLLLALGFGVYKYRSRDEGVYRIDDAKNYLGPNGGAGLANGSSGGASYDLVSKPLVHLDGLISGGERSRSRSRSSSMSNGGSTLTNSKLKRGKENREWYV